MTIVKLSLISATIVAGLIASPAPAQRKMHGAGVSWSGGHGGVSWDGGHSYGGGGYSGYPATATPPPAFKSVPPTFQLPLASSRPAETPPVPPRHSNHAGETDRRK